jgi:hypothetical protein
MRDKYRHSTKYGDFYKKRQAETFETPLPRPDILAVTVGVSVTAKIPYHHSSYFSRTHRSRNIERSG